VSREDYVKRSASFIVHVVGGEKILVPTGAQVLNLNGLVTLNESAAFIWTLLAEERSLEDLTDGLSGQFAVSPAVARGDVQQFVDKITHLGLLES
jgi:hypothetical protein